MEMYIRKCCVYLSDCCIRVVLVNTTSKLNNMAFMVGLRKIANDDVNFIFIDISTISAFS